MLKKLLVGTVLVLLVCGGGLFVWARFVLTGDQVRAAVAAQLTRALGQPVRIGGLSAAILPRVTMTLTDVTLGEPVRVTVKNLDVGTDFRALVRRRIEHGSVRLAGARFELPLPPLTLGGATTSEAAPGRPPVEIVSVDQILLDDVELVSGGRTLRGDLELVPEHGDITVRRVSLAAGDTAMDVTGTITDLSGPVGELSIKAGRLNALDLIGFLADFSRGASTTAAPGTAGHGQTRATTPTSSAMNLRVSLEAERANFMSLVLDRITGRARVTPEAVVVEPARFGVLGGQYDGMLTIALSQPTPFTLGASLAGIDMGALTRFAGSPDSITGRLSGRMDVSGRGTSPGEILRSVRGVARVDVRDGSVKGLGLVRSVVLAGSMRAASQAQLGTATTDEPFSRLSATLDIAGGVATTRDLRFESKNLLLTGAGSFRLDGTAVNITSRVQLSDELSRQAGQDLLRYTQDQGRVTLPATVTGSLGAFNVRIDIADVLKRAITNRAIEEAQKLLRKALGGK
jgi:uncharacterized protein involved in outer membrane biogenesis